MPENTPPDMPDSEPKTLAEIQSGASTAGTQENIIPEPTAAEPTTQPQSSAPSPEKSEEVNSDEEAHYLTLKVDKRQLGREIDRIAREVPEFGQVFNSQIGNKAARKYQPQLEELRAQKLEAEQAAFRYYVQTLPEDQLRNRFNTDPQFAAAYTSLVHATPEQTQQVQVQSQIRNQINSIYTMAEERGLPEDEIQAIEKDLKSGKFDTGQGVQADLAKFNQHVLDKIIEYRTQTAVGQAATIAQVQTQNQPASNPKLLTGSANNGSAAARGPAGVKWTKAEIEHMRSYQPKKFLELFPSDDAELSAIRNGEIDGMGPRA